MTTDRTAAPTRSTALADRPSSAGRTQAPPSDAFAVLLGAVAPKPGDAQVRRDDVAARRDDASEGRDDVSTRRDDVSKRRDDGSRTDRSHRADRRPQPEREDATRVTDKPKDELAPAAAPEATEATEVATDPAAAETPAAPTTPSLFALQLASPLPPAVATEAEATVETAKLPTFASQVPASVAAATTAQAAATAATTGTAETATPATDPQATTGAVALTGLPAEATADTTVPAGLDLSKAIAAADPAATPAQDAGAPADASQQQTGGDASGQEQPNTPAPPTAAPAAAAAAAAPTTAKVDAPVETVPVAAPATTPSVTSQAAPAQVTTPSVERAVPLSRAVASSGLLIQMAAERGVTHARLNLKPVELGGIEVRLRTSPQGVHAQLVADSPEAARMLSSAGEDLRKSLEDKDVTLLSLDVSTSGDQGRDQPAEFTDAFGEAYRPGGWTSHRVSTDDGGLMDSPTPAETTLVLPNGVTVDVLA